MGEGKERYMMATTATHDLGNVSRKDHTPCLVYGEEGDFFVGRWVSSFGFTDVKFPKSTTRELTKEEITAIDS